LLSHENLVQVYAAESNLKEKKTQILMEVSVTSTATSSSLTYIEQHCVGGDLRTLLEMQQSAGTRLQLDTAWSYFVQMAKVLFYLHNSSERADGMGALGHGDVKPENSKSLRWFAPLEQQEAHL
jgi:serine/threonine protein kinase